MLSSSGFLIRFIDIGLILLLGFLWISDISSFTHIEMPNKPPEQSEASQQQSLTFVRVDVAKAGQFVVRQVEPAEEICAPDGRAALEDCLRATKDRLEGNDRRPIVLIEPSDESAVQHTVDVMDVCDRLGIAKNINKSELQL
jgi:biopolymer transport protein ExbD